MAIAKQEAKQIILRPNLIVMLMVMMMNYHSVAGDCNYDEDYDIFFSKHFLNVFDAFVTLLIFWKKNADFVGQKEGELGFKGSSLMMTMETWGQWLMTRVVIMRMRMRMDGWMRMDEDEDGTMFVSLIWKNARTNSADHDSEHVHTLRKDYKNILELD